MNYYIAVDIGGTQMRAACYSPDHLIPIAINRIPTQAAGFTPLERLFMVIESIWPTDGRVAAIGVAAPGPLNPYTGVMVEAPNIPGWENLPLRSHLEDRFKAPVGMGNDANLAALGEWKIGAGQGHHHMMFLTISTGIGGGIITGNRLLVGVRGLAAEVGHMVAVPDGPMCGCGRRGHLEAVASGTGLAHLAHARLAAGEGPDSAVRQMCGGAFDSVTSAMLGAAAQAGDVFARRLFTEAGTHIGRAVASLLHTLNSSIVICGGGVSMLGEVLLEPMRAAVRENAMSDAYWRDCPIVLSALGDDGGLIGAGVLAIEETMRLGLPTTAPT
jgi:glucokinase